MLSATTPLDTLLAIRLPYLWTSQSDSGYDAIPFRTLMLGCFNSSSYYLNRSLQFSGSIRNAFTISASSQKSFIFFLILGDST
ncbi:hypothetical protein [Sporisorium scitamineum]|uniref:Uncharacterized protein n=1 Tax=Sporisorium scitamineum TaxID=49012 RepID=A0A0F7S386_9BASI|nr:hypothetical protein [Sporisorium scitamineum]